MKDFFWRQWYRYSLGAQFVGVINLVLLSITAGKVFGFSGWLSLLVIVPAGLFGVLAWGAFLDLVGKAQQHNEEIYLKRSPKLREMYRKVDEIHGRMCK